MKPPRERIEWCDIWITDAHKESGIKVLMIGDSITRGYFGEAEKRIGAKASCARLTTSRCVSDPIFFDELMLVLRQYDFNVIHFNNGLHGWGYDEKSYHQGFQKLVETLKEHAPKSALICALSTPMRDRSDLQKFTANTERVKERNRSATQLSSAAGIDINDLFAVVVDHPEFHSGDGVHFNNDGKAAQGKAVAESILTALGN